MVTIKVNPELLREQSQRFSSVATGIDNGKRAIDSIIASAPGYDGQFKVQMLPINLEAAVWASSLQARIAAQAEKLTAISNAFEYADNAGLNGLTGILVGFDQWARVIQTLRTVSKLDRATLARLVSLARLGNLGALIGIGIPISVLLANTNRNLINNRKITTNEPGQIASGVSDEVKPVAVKNVTSPVPVVAGGKVTQGFHSDHKAIDLWSSQLKQTPIQASYNGKVVFAKTVNAGFIDDNTITAVEKTALYNDLSKNRGYGNSVVVEYKYGDQTPQVQELWRNEYGMKEGESLYALHAHLSNVAVNPGDTVKAGDTLGNMGNDGLCGSKIDRGADTGVHLHLGYKKYASDSLSPSSNYNWGKINDSNAVDPQKTLSY